MKVEQFYKEKNDLLTVFPWLRWNQKTSCLNGRKDNIEISINYDFIYEIPKILFLVYSDENLLLEFSEVWSLVSKHFQETGRNMMEVISQVEHPVTSLPMYTFHPCNFGSLLNSVKHSEAQHQELTTPILEQKDNSEQKYQLAKEEIINDSEKQINATLLVTSVIFSYLELISDEEYAKMASIGSA